MSVLEQVKEALAKALTWEGRMNEASQMIMQRHGADALYIKGEVCAEMRRARTALAALEACEVVDGQAIGAPLLALDPGNWRFHEGDRTEHFDRPAILLLEAER